MATVMQLFEEHKPALAMVLVQFIYTFGTLAAKALFSNGTSQMVFLTYRQAVASLVMVPTTLLLRGPRKMALGFRAFTLVFAASLIGCTFYQYLYYKGLQMTSISMGSVMNNLVPAVTFLMAASFGLEKLQLRSVRSLAKVVGTIICVGGAVFIAFYKGPKLLNQSIQFHSLSSLLGSVSDEWMIGFIYLSGATCFGSLWLILQDPICKNYLDPLSLATWMCILSTIQSAILTYSLEPELESWKITSAFELLSIIYTGILASGLTFSLQSWVISVKGPVFSALFNPVQIVIATICGFLLLHEEIYLGSFIGAIAVVIGLYIVLWGKAKDTVAIDKLDIKDGSTKSTITTEAHTVAIYKLDLKDGSTKSTITIEAQDGEDDMKKPLLAEGIYDIESQIKR